MTEIDSSWKHNWGSQQEGQFPVDEYHPFSVDWEAYKIEWVRDFKNPNHWIRGVRAPQDGPNPQTGCG